MPHIQIVALKHSGSIFFNYKGGFSIVMLAVADMIYSFIYLDVGCQGLIPDDGVFNNWTLYEKMNNGQLRTAQIIAWEKKLLPYVLVGDDALPLSNNLMKPFPGRNLGFSSPEKVFNYRFNELLSTYLEYGFKV